MAVNWIDILALILIFGFAFKGYRNGLIRQATLIIAVILGVYMATEQYEVFAEFIQRHFEIGDQLANLIAFGIIIIAVSLIIGYLGHLFENMLDSLSLDIVDNICGGLFGAAKAVAIIYILILMVSKLADYFNLILLQQQMDSSFFASKLLEWNSLLEKQIDKFSN